MPATARWTRRRFGRAVASSVLGAACGRFARADTAGPWVLADGGHSLLQLHVDTLAVQQQLLLAVPWARLLVGGASPVGLGADGALRRPARASSATAPCVTGAATASADGRWVCAVEGEVLQLRDAALAPLRRWPLPDTVSWLADLPRRRAFVLAFATRPELWQLSYDEQAEDFYDGLVHDYRLAEGVPTRGFLNVRRMALPEPLADATPDAEQAELAGRGWVFNLDARRRVRSQPLLQPPGAGCGAATTWRGRPALLMPVRGEARIDVYRTDDWSRVTSLALPQPADTALSHPATPGALLLLRGRPHAVAPMLDGVTAIDAPAALSGRPVWRDHGATLWALAGDELLVFDTRSWQLLRRAHIARGLGLA